MSRTAHRFLPILFALAGLSGIALPAQAQSPSQIHWTHISPTAVTFDWRAGADSLRYGLTTAYGTTVKAVAPVPLPFSSSGPFREAKITGLEPNTTYQYMIGGGSNHTFTTAPLPGDASFTIHAVGDIGATRDVPSVGQLQTLIAADRPAFLLALGDLTYGNVQGQASVDQHFIDVQAWSQDAAYMPAWGNHEWEPTDDLRNYKGRFHLPNPQTSPGSPAVSCCGEDWYWFDYGNTRFIAYPEMWTGAWTDWNSKVQPVMAAAQADPAISYIVTFGHRPAYSSGPHGGNAQLAGYLNAFGATYDKYVLDLSGHEHNYQRSHPQNGVVHVVSGTGGRALANYSGTPSWVAFRAVHHGSLRLRFSPSGIKGQLLCGPAASAQNLSCASGAVIDSFFIENPNVDRAPVVTAPATLTAKPGVTARIDVVASDPDGDAIDELTADLTALPATGDASFTPSTATTGVFTWTPVAEDLRTEPYSITFTARNALEGAASTLIRVAEAAPETTKLDRRVTVGADDAEESSNGSVALTSSDLELVVDGTTAQTVGVRFPGLAIPRGATITNAYLQFAVDEVTSGTIALTIRAQAADQALAFTSASSNLSSRARTSASVAWAPAAWTTIGTAGTAQRTPNLAALVAEVTGRTGWASGNALALLVTGTGRRTAEAFEGDATRAPLLHVEYTTGDPPPPPVNVAPLVDAGPDRTITLPSEAALAGVVSDDGLPAAPGFVSLVWSLSSGLAPVTFGSPNAAASTARFTQAGTYVLQLAATDGELAASDSTRIVVQDASTAPVVLDRRVTVGADDAEESANGSVALTSSDLEIVVDGTTAQTVGVRFPGLAIPRGATITNAYLQFAVDEVTSGTIALTIRAQAADQALAFTSASSNLSSRARTSASVAWAPAAWTTIGTAGTAQRTPNLAALVAEVTGRTGWASGNALALLVTGTGRRTAEAFEGDATRAPLLHVEYTTGDPPPPPVNVAPLVDAGPDRTITLPSEAALAGVVSDDGLPAAPGFVSLVWSLSSGPAPVTFGSPNAAASTARFTQAGTYVLQLAATDGELAASDSTRIVVQDASTAPVVLDRRVAVGADDAEESSNGSVALTSSDLEIVVDGTTAQTVGVRFPGLAIPRGATITNAYLQFAVDEVTSGTIALTIRAQAADQALAFTSASSNLSSRARTTASVAWAPAAWTTIGTAGTAQRTPNLAALVAEVTGRAGWASGNALALLVTGTGRRTAEAFEGDAARAPLLHVEYTPAPLPPSVNPAEPLASAFQSGLPVKLAAFVVPSPLARAGTIHLDMPLGGHVTVQLFDVGGRLARDLVNLPYLAPGRHRFPFDPRGNDGHRLAAGVYFYRVSAFGERAQGRVVVLE